MKRIHEEGTRIIIINLLVVSFVLLGMNIYWPAQGIVHVIVYLSALIYCYFVVHFFRVPISRRVVRIENAVLSPADGEVVVNEIVYEDEYFHEERRQISIFMSIHNVHINFFPMDGEVVYYVYHPGKFVVAYNPKSSELNEHNSIVVCDDKQRKVMFRQIAGYVARRIVCDLRVGDKATAGEEFGMIRFGSRVDVFLPLDAEVKVKIGDKTCGMQTPLAILK